jgi:hypothetical protein
MPVHFDSSSSALIADRLPHLAPARHGRKREREILPDRHSLVCNRASIAMLQFSTRQKKRRSAVGRLPMIHLRFATSPPTPISPIP